MQINILLTNQKVSQLNTPNYNFNKRHLLEASTFEKV